MSMLRLHTLVQRIQNEIDQIRSRRTTKSQLDQTDVPFKSNIRQLKPINSSKWDIKCFSEDSLVTIASD